MTALPTYFEEKTCFLNISFSSNSMRRERKSMLSDEPIDDRHRADRQNNRRNKHNKFKRRREPKWPSASAIAHEERAASQLPTQSRLSAFRLNWQEAPGAEDLSGGALRIAKQSAGLCPPLLALSFTCLGLFFFFGTPPPFLHFATRHGGFPFH